MTFSRHNLDTNNWALGLSVFRYIIWLYKYKDSKNPSFRAICSKSIVYSLDFPNLGKILNFLYYKITPTQLAYYSNEHLSTKHRRMRREAWYSSPKIMWIYLTSLLYQNFQGYVKSNLRCCTKTWLSQRRLIR